MYNALLAAAEFSLHVASFLAIFGMAPLNLDVRIGLAILHTIAVMLARRQWPRLAWRYLCVSTCILALLYAVLLYTLGPKQILARTFGLADVNLHMKIDATRGEYT
jgi:hypothetical protein